MRADSMHAPLIDLQPADASIRQDMLAAMTHRCGSQQFIMVLDIGRLEMETAPPIAARRSVARRPALDDSRGEGHA
jgi:hypothetical protein